MSTRGSGEESSAASIMSAKKQHIIFILKVWLNMKKTWIWLAVSLVVAKISFSCDYECVIWACCLNAAIALVVTAFKAENYDARRNG